MRTSDTARWSLSLLRQNHGMWAAALREAGGVEPELARTPEVWWRTALFLPGRCLRRKEMSIGLGWGSGQRGQVVVPEDPSDGAHAA